jgi:PAS domain S-box-containing protein
MLSNQDSPDSRDYHVFENVEQLTKVVKSLFHNSFESAVLTSPEIDGHKFICVNPAFCKMTGYSQNELLGQSPKILQGNKTNRPMMKRLRQDLVERTPFHGAAINYRKDGAIYHVEWKINPVYDLSGNLLCFFSIQRDLTYLKSFLNRIKLTSEHVRDLLKRVKELPLAEISDKGLKESINQATVDEVNNFSLFSPSLRADADIDLFDDELFLDSDHPTGIMPMQVKISMMSAKQFHATTTIEREDIEHLCSIIADCIFGVDLLSTNVSNDSARASLIKDMQEFANVLFFMDEFVNLSTVLGELSRKLAEYKEPQFPPFILDILITLLTELNAWVTTVFVDRSSNNIHELDASLIGSTRQLLMFL